MKSSELHRMLKRHGWVAVRQNGSHVLYEKENKLLTVPYHGAKEIPTGTAVRILRDAGLIKR